MRLCSFTVSGDGFTSVQLQHWNDNNYNGNSFPDWNSLGTPLLTISLSHISSWTMCNDLNDNSCMPPPCLFLQNCLTRSRCPSHVSFPTEQWVFTHHQWGALILNGCAAGTNVTKSKLTLNLTPSRYHFSLRRGKIPFRLRWVHLSC